MQHFPPHRDPLMQGPLRGSVSQPLRGNSAARRAWRRFLSNHRRRCNRMSTMPQLVLLNSTTGTRQPQQLNKHRQNSIYEHYPIADDSSTIKPPDFANPNSDRRRIAPKLGSHWTTRRKKEQDAPTAALTMASPDGTNRSQRAVTS